MRVGVVVNPIAGMGGRVGLKGTDGKVAEARARGAKPRAPARAERFCSRLADHKPAIEVVTAGGAMGGEYLQAAGFDVSVVYEPAVSSEESETTTGETTTGETTAGETTAGETTAGETTAGETTTGETTAGETTTGETTAEDTMAAVAAFIESDVDLVVFVGGDGTAGDVAEAVANAEIPMLGVPAGVKVYSSVFAVSPEAAADIVVGFDRTENREVMDIDEDEYRSGGVSPELRAVAAVPVDDNLQSAKEQGGGSISALAAGVAADVDSETTYILGPGSTLAAIKTALGFEGSPLGVDVWRDGELLATDASEAEILAAMGEQNTIIVSPIGGQGFIFGRGNPQLSPAVIRQASVTIVASRSKLDTLGVLRVDTDDPELDAELRGWKQVRVGRFETRMMQVT